MEQSKEYIEKCLNIYQNGGILWLIEKKDTGEFCQRELKMWESNKPETWHDTYLWSKNISFFTIFFLTKEDAEKGLDYMDLREGGCHCCGHLSKSIPVLITEHEFVISK